MNPYEVMPQDNLKQLVLDMLEAIAYFEKAGIAMDEYNAIWKVRSNRVLRGTVIVQNNDSDEIEEERIDRQLRLCEYYWRDKSNEALRQGKYNRSNVYGFRARFYHQLRTSNIIY